MCSKIDPYQDFSSYKCHKVVRAAQILDITHCASGYPYLHLNVSPGTECMTTKRLPMTAEFMKRHNPHVGGYLMIYGDAYMSYSPQKPFEEGYTAVEPQTVEMLLVDDVPHTADGSDIAVRRSDDRQSAFERENED